MWSNLLAALVGALAALVGAHLISRRADVGRLGHAIKSSISRHREQRVDARQRADAAVLLSFEEAKAAADAAAHDDEAPTVAAAPRSKRLDAIKERARRIKWPRLMPRAPRGDA